MYILPGLPLLLYTALALARDVLHYRTPLSVRARVRRRRRRGQEQNYQTEAKERIETGGEGGLIRAWPPLTRRGKEKKRERGEGGEETR